MNQVHEWILEINKELEITKDEEIDWIYIHEVGSIFRTEGRVIKMADGKTGTAPRPYYSVATGEDTLLVMLMQLLTIDVLILGRYDPNAYFSRMSHPAFP